MAADGTSDDPRRGEPSHRSGDAESSDQIRRRRECEELLSKALVEGDGLVRQLRRFDVVQRAAGRHRGGLTDELIVELVESWLREDFRVDLKRSSRWSAAARAVADSLANDPVSRERLERLWASVGRGQT